MSSVSVTKSQQAMIARVERKMPFCPIAVHPEMWSVPKVGAGAVGKQYQARNPQASEHPTIESEPQTR
jgi:hypothetical protein